METCGNCGRKIGDIEPVFLIKQVNVVCQSCNDLLDETACVVDESCQPLGPKPKAKSWFSLDLNPTDYLPIKKIKMVFVDVDLSKHDSSVIDVDNSVDLNTLAEPFKVKTGKKLTKVVVLERFWKAVPKVSRLDKVVGAVAVIAALDEIA
jgi:hypothetical protein